VEFEVMKRWFLRIERDGFVGFEREEEREREIWGWGWPWETVRRKKEKLDFDCVWQGLLFYLQNDYVACLDWRV
jgi:hypothetical protein